MGGIGGFGKVAKSGVNSKKRRQGWWGGLGVGEGWNCPMPVSTVGGYVWVCWKWDADSVVSGWPEDES
jgi:hypothetical protein